MTSAPETGLVMKGEDEWRAVLSPEQFRILRGKGTDKRGKGEYVKHFEEGIYNCAGCGASIYKSVTKFDSGCGFPAFYDAIPGAVKRTEEMGGRKYELTCTKCDCHIGHVFKDEGFQTPTGERHCVNSVSLKFASEIPPQN